MFYTPSVRHTAASSSASGAAQSPTGDIRIPNTLRRQTEWVIAYNLVTFFVLLLRPVAHEFNLVASDILEAIGPVLAASFCFGSLRRGQARQNWPVALVGAALLSWGAGQCLWNYSELMLHRDAPSPGLCDFGYLLSYPLLLAAVFRMPLRPLPHALRGRVLLDGLMTLTALVTFSWYFILGPTLHQSSESLLGKLVSLGYPLGDMTLLFCVLMLSAHGGDGRLSRRALALCSFGLLAVVESDTAYAYLNLRGTYSSGGLSDLGWPLGYMLLGLGALTWGQAAVSYHRQAGTARTEEQRNVVLWRSLMPYALVPAVGALLVYILCRTSDAALALGVYLGCALLIGLILLRQVFAILENAHLNRYLRQAYSELQTARTTLETQNNSLAEANTRLESLATTDGMTGLANHRAFQQRLRACLVEAERSQSPLALLLMDVDNFKNYNDSFGHPAGDDVLKQVARLLEESLRGTDLAARYGGEEFVALLPRSDVEIALRIAERLRAAVAAHTFPHRPITLSVGVSVWTTTATADPPGLISRADRALYDAKHQGRNSVALDADLARYHLAEAK